MVILGFWPYYHWTLRKVNDIDECYITTLNKLQNDVWSIAVSAVVFPLGSVWKLFKYEDSAKSWILVFHDLALNYMHDRCVIYMLGNVR